MKGWARKLNEHGCTMGRDRDGAFSTRRGRSISFDLRSSMTEGVGGGVEDVRLVRMR